MFTGVVGLCEQRVSTRRQTPTIRFFIVSKQILYMIHSAISDEYKQIFYQKLKIIGELMTSMRSLKKANNYFEKPILHQSLFHQETQNDYRIGGRKIEKDWLKNQPPQQYRANIKSALQLAELKQKYDILLMKKSHNQVIDIFRLEQLKNKIQNFDRVKESPRKKKQSQLIKIEQINLKVQKIADFWGNFERNAKVINNTLYIESKKQNQEKTVDLTPYNFTIQQKENIEKNSESKKFQWLPHFLHRLFLTGENLRDLCLYADQKILKNISKKLNLQKLKKQNLNFLKEVEKKYTQKIYINFGNKLRLYEKYYQEMEKRKLAQHLLGNLDELKEENQNDGLQKNEVKKSSLKVPSQKENNETNLMKECSNISMASSSLIKSKSKDDSNPLPPRKQTFQSSSVFRMKSKRSTIFYDELDNDDDPTIISPQIKIGEINLEMKEVALSQEESKSIGQDQEDMVEEKFPKNPLYPLYSLENNGNNNSNRLPFFQQTIEQSQIIHHKKTKTKMEADEPFYEFCNNEMPATHFIKLCYFQYYIKKGQKNLQFTFFQKISTDEQYQNMKVPVFNVSTFELVSKENSNTCFFYPKQEIILKVTQKQKYFGIKIQEQFKNMEFIMFQIDLTKIKYQTDQSQFINLKNKRKGTKLCGKLKLLCSPQPIIDKQLQTEQTINLLSNLLFSKSFNRSDVYELIDEKKRDHEIRQCFWNKVCCKALKMGDKEQFQKIIFLGISSEILQKVQQYAQKHNFRYKNKNHKNMSMKSVKNFISKICLTKVYDLRMMMKIQCLIDLIIKGDKNFYFEERLDTVSKYYFMREGNQGVDKLLSILALEICLKLEPIFVRLSHENEVKFAIQEYFYHQYEINSLFSSVSTYFN